MKYLVDVPEVCMAVYEVEADSGREAIQMIIDGTGSDLRIIEGGEFSHVLEDSPLWYAQVKVQKEAES